MKYLFISFLALFIFSSCNSQQSEAKKIAKEIKQTVEENTPGTIPTKEGGLTMRATIAGKAWVANAMMPPEAAGRIIGYYNQESISLPYDRRDLFVGNKITFSENNVVDLFINDDIGIYGGRKGEMRVTKVDKNWAEGTFYFTGSTVRGSTNTIPVTDGFFRIAIPKAN
jgi:hypothetical protein